MQTEVSKRDYSVISPTAKSLLLLKGGTPIPYARRVAELITQPSPYMPDYTNTDFNILARIVHFEKRYWSLDNLLEDIPAKNILELSSGFSFRGLHRVQQHDCHYIDTDLPEIIALKKEFVTELQSAQAMSKGTLEILPLNALDEEQFNAVIDRFPPGEITIINEGLLIYLGPAEKEKLFATIHRVLKERGGYWITADIYVRKKSSLFKVQFSEKEKQFFEQLKTEENKFESFKAAKAFFENAGFVIDKEAQVNRSKLSALPHLLKKSSFLKLFFLSRAGKTQTTWRLKVRN